MSFLKDILGLSDGEKSRKKKTDALEKLSEKKRQVRDVRRKKRKRGEERNETVGQTR